MLDTEVEIPAGTKYDSLTVIRRVEDYISPKGQHARRYLCKCDCGEEYITRGSWLKCGKSSCCNQCSKAKVSLKKTIDLTNLHFGRWTVLEKVGTEKAGTYWKCRCDCGTEKIIRGTSLTSGNSISCGCYALEKLREDRLLNLTGKKFDRLTVLCQVEDFISPINGKRRSRWKCQCDCGNQKVIQKDSLMNGTISCGCLNSRGERKIAEYLREHNIKYKIQYGFPDLVGGLPLKFDFAVFDRSDNLIALVEYQGEQHFEAINFFGGKEKFERQKMNDEMKRLYCKEKRIPLIEIPYWENVDNYLKSFLGRD